MGVFYPKKSSSDLPRKRGVGDWDKRGGEEFETAYFGVCDSEE